MFDFSLCSVVFVMRGILYPGISVRIISKSSIPSYPEEMVMVTSQLFICNYKVTKIQARKGVYEKYNKMNNI